MSPSLLNKTVILGVALTISFSSMASSQQDEMKREEVSAYMQAYDDQFDVNRLAMQENIEDGLLIGELKITSMQSCQNLEDQKYDQQGLLKKEDPKYFEKLGSLDGKWDGRIVGCQDAYALMNQRLVRYKNDIKKRWNEKVSLGEKVAALEIELFSKSPSELEDQCFDAHRVQGLVQFFMADEVAQGQQLASVQLECQGQAQVIAQRYERAKQRRYIASRETSAYRASASLSE